MRRHPLLLAVTACGLLLTACGPHRDLALDLRSVTITVPRLVTPAVELVPPAPAPPPVALPPIPPLVTYLPPAVSTPSAPPVAAPAPACPKASSLDVPAQPASQTVDTPPAPAKFTQAATGSFAADGKKGSLAGAQTVAIGRQPNALTSVGQKVDTYQVTRTDPLTKAKSVEVYQLVHPSDSPAATAPGIYLVGMAWNDPVRGNLSFHPGSGLQILPSPVALAQAGTVQYAGSATDPDTLTTLTLARNVTGRKRVDACGQLIDTFTVEMTGTLVTRDSTRQIAWTQQLATSYGGVDVEDTLTLTNQVDGFTWTRHAVNTALPKETA